MNNKFAFAILFTAVIAMIFSGANTTNNPAHGQLLWNNDIKEFQQSVAYSDQEADYNQGINAVIGEGLQECSSLKNDNCIAVMSTLNNICQVAYFPNWFGNEAWTPFMNHLEKMIKEGDISREDPYITLNNEHFGNDSIMLGNNNNNNNTNNNDLTLEMFSIKLEQLNNSV